MDLQEKLNGLPDKPGVYLMKDSSDTIIYVGKAKSLRKRVRQYFGSYGKSSRKVNSMVKHIRDLEYIIVENEVESLLLEQNLIKEKRPKYNILLRDDKQYPYIKVTVQETYPRVMKTRRILKDGAKYFGPYPNATAVNEAIDIFHNLYPIRNCKLNLEKNIGKVRPCLNYFIHRCVGPCLGNVDEKEYRKMIDEILEFLEGRDEILFGELEKKMNKASQNLEFEKACEYRDALQALHVLTEKQVMAHAGKDLEQDVIGLAHGMNEICIQIFFVRGGNIIGREHFFLDNFYHEGEDEIISSFIKQFYSGVARIPKEIIVEDYPRDQEAIEIWLRSLRGTKVDIIKPQRGEKKELLKLVKENALDMTTKYSNQYLRRQRNAIVALEELKDLLHLKELPERIEAYDISNISGVESVGSMVVFEKGISKKSDYRKFRIKSIIGPDDYGSMREVLQRRFLRGLKEKEDEEFTSFSLFPDLLFIDGGKGQVNTVTMVLHELGVDIPIAGLVKDDFHQTRGIIFNQKEYPLDVDSRIYKLVFQIQEEAHRFAINYHRSLHKKSMFRSELDNIPWIGPKRKQNLMKHFKSLDKIKSASEEELLEVKGMNQKAVQSLRNHFQRGEK
ncbi:MAG: excinuclease ABC subunit UvrC [Tissierellia bacterium]|nr:excinuclease ABC subunit UvrC [Tissierellia bacterium]